MTSRLEVHEHCYISGPNSRCAGTARWRLAHSHEGGDRPHVHEDETHRTGPASYTIDSKAWARATGMPGGGKKRFTLKPTGQQLPTVFVDPPRIDIVVVGDGGASIAGESTGGADVSVERMLQGMKARVHSVTHVSSGSKRGARG